MKPPTCTLTITLMGIWILATSTSASYTWDDVLRASYESQEQAIAHCSSQAYVGDGLIIDIRQSVSSGAQLLDGEFQSSLSACIASCCLRQECELALFKSTGESLSGKNCYFIQCIRPENCKMVPHTGFISVSLVGGRPNWEVSRHGDGDTREGDSDDRTGHPPPSPPYRPTIPITSHAPENTPLPAISPSPETTPLPIDQTTPTQETTTHSATDTSLLFETQASTTTDDNQQTTTSVSTTTTTTTIVSMTTTTTAATTEEQASEVATTSTQPPRSDKPETNSSVEPTQDPLAPDDDDNNNEEESSNSESRNEQSDHTGDSHSVDRNGSNRASSDAGGTDSDDQAIADDAGLDQEDPCGRDGCDGSGIIPVAVIGSVSFVILLLIAMVVLKRVIDIRRKRKFRNVDYLINGMYT